MVIGGTSGIGLALARHYAGQGAQVAICGRDLGRVDPDILARHPGLRLYQFDIADKAAVGAAIDDFACGALDTLVVTAGFYADAATLERDPAAGTRMLHTNVGGLNNAFEAAARGMMARKSGHLVAVASIAGLLRDYPGASLYSANKRLVIALCALYRKTLAPFSVAVTVIVPGYVDTARLRELNNCSAANKPYLLSEQQALVHMVKAIDGRVARSVFPWQLHWMVMAFNCLPLLLRRLRDK
ncbi:MAG: SDR family NAD(P)-dependent oxidoreductase [Pseudomonadota bacterium]